MADLKICTECRHNRDLFPLQYCYRPIAVPQDPVTGVTHVPRRADCRIERRNAWLADRCGRDGRYWEPKEQE